MTDVTKLDPDDLDKLDDDQRRYVANLYTRSLNPKVTALVKDALKEKEEEIIAAFTMPPFAYIGPEIEIIKGFKVKLRTLYEDQNSDVNRAAREFASEGDPSQLEAGIFINKCYLAHSLETVNGQHFANIQLPEAYVNVAFEDPVAANDILVEMREKRMRSLGAYPMPMVQALYDAHQVFQQTVDGVIRGEKVTDILGN